MNVIKSLSESAQAMQAIKEVKSAGTPKQKMLVLEKYKDNEILQKIIYYTYNPYMKYGITKKTFQNYLPEKEPEQTDSLYSLLDLLAKSNINDSLRNRVVNFVSMFEGESQDIIKGIFCKDLKLGISATTFNKVWPGIIPVFEVQLAAKYANVKLDENEYIWITEKFDGIRCVCIIENDTVKFFTRQGKEIFGLKEIEESVKCQNFVNMVLDGELLYSGECEDSAMQYKKTTKIVNSKMENKTDVAFNVFDILPLEEFKSGYSSLKYENRRKILNTINQTDSLKVAPILYEGTDHSKIMEVHKIMVDKHKEGVMINRNARYECKRTKNLLKVKEMNDADLKVIGYEEGRGEMQGMLGSLIVDYKGNRVNVGSGFSKEDRQIIWENKEDIIGKIIKVQFFEESKNAQGGVSLRFPVFLEIRNDKTEPSYE